MKSETDARHSCLLPYLVIVAATKGDPDAMDVVIHHFDGYFADASRRTLYDQRGNTYTGIDVDIRDRVQAKLMLAVLTFDTQ